MVSSRFARVSALVSLAVLVFSGTASAAPATPAVQAASNPWLQQRFLNMAHAGGENEAPLNTMYAFKRVLRAGADMIELDIHSTADSELVVIHNATVDATTNGTGRVRDMTLAQVRALDAAYNFVPGRSAVPGLPPESYPLRGIRTGNITPPAGYVADDFAIPSLHDVLRVFPGTPINIEIKGTSNTDIFSFIRTARLLARLLNQIGRTDIIVTSFNDLALSTLHMMAPDIPLAPGVASAAMYFLTGMRPIAGTVALQIPVQYNGIQMATPEFIAKAHTAGYAVHVWFSGTAPENEATYNALIDACADGLMPAWPTLLERILDERQIARPGTPGIDPCAANSMRTTRLG